MNKAVKSQNNYTKQDKHHSQGFFTLQEDSDHGYNFLAKF